METPLLSPKADRVALATIAAFAAIKAILHLLLVERYGYHGDELYFLECGRHLALGYVDHPPLIPWIARLADEMGGGLLALRVPAIVAGAGTIVLTGLLVREWGGGRSALLLALLSLLVAPAHLRLGAMLNIPVFEIFFCTASAYFVARALARGAPKDWLFAGGSLGVAVLAKHSAIFWGAALAVGLLASPQRKALRSPWPWTAVALAAALAAPNLLWQAAHGFPTLEFLQALRGEVLAEQGRGLFVAGQLLYFHPLALPVWLAGLGYGLTRGGEAARPFAILFAALFVFLLVMGGKPYYLGSAYSPLLAAGGVALERALAARKRWRRVLIGSLAGTGAALGLVTLPVLPLPKVDAVIQRLLGWVVPPMALTHDLHGMYGWEEQAATIEAVYRGLPEADRNRVSILAGSYSQAAAVNRFRSRDVPRAVSGHMTYFLWGPDGHRGDVLIAFGLPIRPLERHYRRCEPEATIVAPLARPWDTDLPVFVCRDPTQRLSEFWGELRRFGHAAPREEPVPSAEARAAPR